MNPTLLWHEAALCLAGIIALNSPGAAPSWMKTETELWAKVIEAANIRAK